MEKYKPPMIFIYENDWKYSCLNCAGRGYEEKLSCGCTGYRMRRQCISCKGTGTVTEKQAKRQAEFGIRKFR